MFYLSRARMGRLMWQEGLSAERRTCNFNLQSVRGTEKKVKYYPVRLSLFQGPLNPFNGFHFPPQPWSFDQKYANQRPKFSQRCASKCHVKILRVHVMCALLRIAAPMGPSVSRAGSPSRANGPLLRAPQPDDACAYFRR